MNINDPDIDLTLALGSGNCTRVNSTSGAGVNANSRGYFPFAASDPLSELVWSPNNGLGLKCTNSNMVNKETVLTWNVDEGKKDNSTSRSTRSKDSRGIKVSNEKNMRMFRSSGGTSSSNLGAYQRNCEVKVSDTLAPSLANLQAHGEATSASGDVKKNKTRGPSLMMLESSAENELAGKDGAPTNSRMCLYQEKGKGKEKASSDGDMWARSSNDEDDSHESMESCNSTGLCPRGVEGLNFGQPQIMGSKRTRKENQPDSSFMNWISNMVKGLSDYSKRDPSPLNVVLNETRPSMGFQTVFQSMYHRTTNDNQADGNKENSCKQLVLASNSSECKRLSSSRSSCEKVNSSLWITRLYTKNDRLENCSSECRNRANDGDAVRASDEMASVFAKRLDALRHILKPSETTRSLSCQLTCLFCGGIGHDLRKCPKLTAAELKDLLVKMDCFDKIEESPCLCIRCFQLDHWAISCPRSDDKCSRKRPSTSNLLQKSSSSIYRKGKARKIIVPEEEMFNAISKLRLSRANILRWMNSDTPLSQLNGFFLRLRVGKVEGGLEGTTYYVACIKGDVIESINSKSKKSILVDVGGIRSCVGIQYISNHDFLEDEIKAWWSRIVNNGCKIPSLDELNSKCERKKRLSL